MGNPVPQPETTVLACGRIPVKRLERILPAGCSDTWTRFKEGLEHNQKIASCCRHPENHDIEAFKSKPEETAPDIYVFYCTCGRKHRRFCCGNGVRPAWEVR